MIFATLSFLLIAGIPANVHAAAPCEGILIRHYGPTSVRAGELLTYKIQVTNEGPCELTQATLTDYLPRQTQYREGTPAPSHLPSESSDPTKPYPVRSLRWNEVTLAPHGGQAIFEVKLQVDPSAKRTLTETACIEHPAIVRLCNTLELWVATNR